MVDVTAGSDSCCTDTIARPRATDLGSAVMQSPRDACEPDIGVPVFGKQSLSPACQFALIAERAQFDCLEADWNALFDGAGRPHQVFQQFSWLWHWANHY